MGEARYMGDKRRGGSGPGGSVSHVLRTTPGTSSSSAPAPPGPSSASNAASAQASAPSNPSSNRNNVILPPPRAALSSTNTNTAADDTGSGNGGGGGGGAKPSGRSTPSNLWRQDDGTGGNNHANGGNNTNVAVSAAAAATQLVREKDMRIAALERELATMEAEFGRELNKLSQNESETATFWQAKHSSLNQQFLRADTELRLLRNEVELRNAERGELGQEWEAMRRDLAERDVEVRDLRSQVRGLKDWVSTSTRSPGGPATSDEVFADGFARLGNGLQNWVIVNFRRVKLDLSSTSQSVLEELSNLVPTYEELVHSYKLHLLQSLVSRILVEMVFDNYFVGLTEEQASQFAEMEVLLTQFSGDMKPVNQWRSATLAILSKGAPERMKDEISRLVERVISRVNRLVNAMTPASSSSEQQTTAAATGSTTSTEARDNGLRQLASSAVELSRLLVVQRASFIVLMPEVLPGERTHFDPATMEDVGGRDEDSLADAEVRCVTFPGVIKRGDESGGGLMQYENVICKSRVLCSAG